MFTPTTFVREKKTNDNYDGNFIGGIGLFALIACGKFVYLFVMFLTSLCSAGTVI